MAQKAKVSISISALFEPGQGFVLDAICNVFRIFTHYISYFVFVIGFYLNLVWDMCKTFKLDFSIQFGIFMGRSMYSMLCLQYFHCISCFVFVFGFCLNLLGDLCWTGLGRKSKFEGIARWLSCTVGAHNRTCPTQKYEFKFKKIENGPAAKKQ